MTVTELSRKSGRSRSYIYKEARRLGRFPTEEELANVQLGRPPKYFFDSGEIFEQLELPLNALMDFSQALVELKKGKKLTRRAWENLGGVQEAKKEYVQIEDGRIWGHLEGSQIKFFFDLMQDDLLAEDWKILEI